LNSEERNKIVNSIIYPLLFVGILSIVHLVQYVLGVNWFHYGIYPLTTKSLPGIIFTVFIHGDFNHLFNNAIPLLILGTMLFYFYKKIALRIVVWVVLMGGFWTWISAREAYHVGASGLIYGLFSFLMLSGFIRRNKQLIALSFFVVLVYGSMVWGIFPIKINVSYEAHFWGFVSGSVLALYYRKQGPQKVIYQWPEEDDEDNDENAYWKIQPNQSSRHIVYHYKPGKEGTDLTKD